MVIKNKNQTTVKSAVVGVRVTPDLYKWLKRVADEEGLKVGDVIRRELILMRRRKAA